jgi:hypothetical protein
MVLRPMRLCLDLYLEVEHWYWGSHHSDQEFLLYLEHFAYFDSELVELDNA